MLNKIYNTFLSFRYKFFKPKKRKTFNGEIIYHKDHFTNINDFQIPNEFYNQTDNWLDENIPTIVNNQIYIPCIFNPMNHVAWNGNRTTNWITGMIRLGTEANPIINYGTWSATVKTSNSFPAIWLLKEKYYNIDGIETITPEIDIMEVIKGKFQHTIHFKPTPTKYSTDGQNNSISKWNDNYHEFTVDITKEAYKFYIDGILTAKFIANKDNSSSAKFYMIINNAAHPGDINHNIGFIYPMYIKNITIRKNKDTNN